MATYLKFDLAPDRLSTGGANHQSRITMKFNGTAIGTADSAVESGNDGVHDWATITYDITALWVGDGTDVFSWRFYDGAGGVAPFLDTGYIRVLRIEDGSGNWIERDQHGDLFDSDTNQPIAVSGAGGGSWTNHMYHVCGPSYSGTTSTGDVWNEHYFPGNRCAGWVIGKMSSGAGEGWH